jgi:hypothetical protein
MTRVVVRTHVDMSAARQPGAPPGAEPDERKQCKAHRASLAATAATDGIAEKENIRPVAHAKVRGTEIGGTALTAIGNHRAIILRSISSGEAGARKAAPLCEAMIPPDQMSSRNSPSMAERVAAGVHSVPFLGHAPDTPSARFFGFAEFRHDNGLGRSDNFVKCHIR